MGSTVVSCILAISLKRECVTQLCCNRRIVKIVTIIEIKIGSGITDSLIAPLLAIILCNRFPVHTNFCLIRRLVCDGSVLAEYSIKNQVIVQSRLDRLCVILDIIIIQLSHVGTAQLLAVDIGKDICAAR